jgi:hypothetical protein
MVGEPDDVGKQLKNGFSNKAFADLKDCIGKFGTEIHVPISRIPIKEDVRRGLVLLDEFHKYKIEYYKSQLNGEDFQDFLQFVDEGERSEIDRQMALGDKLSDSFQQKIQFGFLNYTIENAEIDSKLRRKLTEFTLMLLFLTWILVEIELIRDSSFFVELKYCGAILVLIIFIYYVLRNWRDSM